MKKKLFLMMSLLLTTMGAMASHWTFNPRGWDGETVLYCDLLLGADKHELTDNDYADYEVAAYVDGELRGVSTATENPAVMTHRAWYFEMRVKGSTADNGKTITFKVFNSRTGFEYDLTLVEEPLPITYDGTTKDPGVPSNLRHLYLTEVTALSLQNPITLNVGDEIDLTQYITVTPSGAALPNNLTWEASKFLNYISIDGNTLTAVAPTDGEGVELILEAGQLSATTQVIVKQPATALTIKDEYKTITVAKGDWETLTAALAAAYELTPANATDEVTWVSANTDIVRFADSNAAWNPVAGGTTTMTARILDADGSVRLSATLTVIVTVPVTGITIDLASGSLNCNVGDDLTTFVNGLASVVPADATNQTVHWRLSDDSEAECISFDNDQILAVLGGECTLVAYSDENPAILSTLPVRVHNPAKDINIVADEITVYLSDNNGSLEVEGTDVSREVAANFSLLPTGYSEYYGTPMVTSDNPSVLSTYIMYGMDELDPLAYMVSATAFSEGQATVTVSVEYEDYLKDYTEPTQAHTITVSKSFVVNVEGAVVEVTGLSVSFDSDASELVVSPIPDNATNFDGGKVGYTLTTGNGTWTGGEITDGYTDGDGNFRFQYDGYNYPPGLVMVELTYEDTEITAGTEFENPAHYSFDGGWDWRTFYYGSVTGSGLYDVFGDDLVEIRTEDKLLYNDSQYGYFGGLTGTGLQQNECFKVKVAEDGTVSEFPLYGGYFGEEETVTLYAGWTWIPNPYFYDRLVSNIFTGANAGDRLVSFNSFTEYTGYSWMGMLTTLEQGQGYLYYNAGEDRTFTFPSEYTMAQMDEFQPQGDDESEPIVVPIDPVNAKRHTPRVTENGRWGYDAHAYRDNMTIVATLDVSDPENYTVGAFVGDECRGEGRCIEGRMFITVHAEAGEQVSFKLHNSLTDEFSAVRQTVPFGMTLGTLAEPFALAKGATISGVEAIDNSQLNIDSKAGAVYDLQGRNCQLSINNYQLKPGLYIVGGKKVLVK